MRIPPSCGRPLDHGCCQAQVTLVADSAAVVKGNAPGSAGASLLSLRPFRPWQHVPARTWPNRVTHVVTQPAGEGQRPARSSRLHSVCACHHLEVLPASPRRSGAGACQNEIADFSPLVFGHNVRPHRWCIIEQSAVGVETEKMSVAFPSFTSFAVSCSKTSGYSAFASSRKAPFFVRVQPWFSFPL